MAALAANVEGILLEQREEAAEKIAAAQRLRAETDAQYSDSDVEPEIVEAPSNKKRQREEAARVAEAKDAAEAQQRRLELAKV